MSSYTGRHAELYDIFYSDKEYEREAGFIHECIQQHIDGPARKLLDLACGTGNHSFCLESFGYDIVATDLSDDMLRVARRKARVVGSRVDFVLQDMKYLDLHQRPFDAAICLFDSIGYLVTNDALKQFFEGVHQHLRPGGLFIIEFWHAAPMIKSYEPVRIRKWDTGEGQVIRISETNLDYLNQTGQVRYTIIEQRNDRTCPVIEEWQVNRFFLVQEIRMWLSEHDFEPVQFFGGFSKTNAIDDKTWHIIAVAIRQ